MNPYNDLEPHDRSVARDRLDFEAHRASYDVDDDDEYDVDYDDEEDEDDGCPLCGRKGYCSGYCT